MNQQAYTPYPDDRPRFDSQTGEPIYYPPEPPVKKNYSVTEVLFAWLALLAGYAFCRVFPVVSHPFGGMLFIWALYIVSAVVLKLKGAAFGLMPILMGASTLLISPALILSANSFIHYLVYLYALAVYAYFISASCGNTLERGLSDLLPMDFLKAIFVMPFASFGKLFGALFSGRFKFGFRSFWKVLLGIGIAIIPTAVVVLLLSYDPDFKELFQKLFDFGWADIFSHTFSLLFGIPIAMLIYGMFHSSINQKCADLYSAEGCRAAAARMKFLPRLTTLAATLPVLVVYGVYFASQWKYYMAGFAGVLPDSVTYAGFAREGFFQLCAVSVINLLFIIAMQLFTRRSSEKPAPVTRVLSVVFSCATLVLIATAIAKLLLYIDRYGLTPKRLYAGWFMVVLAAIFLLIFVKQLVNRFRLVPVATLVSVALLGVLVLSGVDTRIAEYNVDRYLAGDLETVDVEALEELGDAAVPSLVKLAKELDAQNGTDIRSHVFDDYDYDEEDLYNQVGYALLSATEREPSTLYSFTLPRYRAERALKEAGITEIHFE